MQKRQLPYRIVNTSHKYFNSLSCDLHFVCLFSFAPKQFTSFWVPQNGCYVYTECMCGCVCVWASMFAKVLQNLKICGTQHMINLIITQIAFLQFSTGDWKRRLCNSFTSANPHHKRLHVHMYVHAACKCNIVSCTLCARVCMCVNTRGMSNKPVARLRLIPNVASA